MTRPIWDEAPGLPKQGGGNIGLRFTKHFDFWEGREWRAQKGAVAAWVESLPNDGGREAPLLGRRRDLIAALEGLTWAMRTVSRLIIGVGNPHPVENGLTWHPTLGVPFLPASGLKGLAKAYAAEDVIPGTEDEVIFKRIFGGDDDQSGGTGGHGSVLFFDALPRLTGKGMLDWDIMTPHYNPWYMASAPSETPPGDWYDPIPIQFLTVAQECTFDFAIAPDPSAVDADQARKDMGLAKAWLENAASDLGVGAKTAVGYGQMDRV